MAAVPTKEERDANLEALRDATNTWADKEVERLDNEAKFLRKVVKGRTGSEKLGTANLLESSSLVQTEIDAFILFDG